MANIQEVARKAGVSSATVSRVLNNTTVVSSRTKMKVEKAIKELQYEPSMLGRNLRKSESRLLLVLIHSFSNPFFSKIINGIEDHSIANNYNILLCESDSDPQRENIFLNMVRNKLADGVISMNPAVDMEMMLDLAEKHSIIFCSEYYENDAIPYVTIDNEAAAYKAVKHLIKLGNEKIAFISYEESFVYAKQRRNGYERALREFGLPMREEWIYNAGGLDFQDGVQAVRKFLQCDERPTAVFAVSDTLAIGALKEVNVRGIKIPDEMAVVGFDNINFSNMTNPTLSTVSQPMYDMGYKAASMLIDSIQGKAVDSVIMDHELIIRESTLS
ncbi:LacI family DNA-binding transcriptional regulator [Lentibacillus sediminis]|uniref:LacI family DNA-binding transcriptional regulator n=1 Tax=Lentibacillus sediminis TaxID=1940529 RepID=UPI000C1B8CE3|nr:LacI family DNA-binding transcriptional regulator [Lentibacillus sediminis]